MIRLFIFLLLIFVSGCDETPLELNNDLDPSNPDHIPPNIESIYTTPGMVNGIINANSVTIQYEGNIEDLEFQYQLDGTEWSDWSSEPRVTLNFLDEGSHIFLVQCRYLSGEIEVNPDTLQFEIDAIDGPSIRIFPLLTEISNGEEFNIEIWAEEVVNVAAMEIVLRYDMQMLEITQENIAIGDYFSQNGGSIIDFISIEEQGDYGEITINIGVYSGEPGSVSGSGPVISISPTAIMNGTTDLELLDGDIILREPNNEDIEIEDAVNGKVVIE